MLYSKKTITKTTASPARVAGKKRNIDELIADFTGLKIKKAKTKSEDEAEEEAPISTEALPSILDDDLSLELSSMSMSSSSSSSSPPQEKKLTDLDDDALRHIGSFLTPKHRRALALTCHDAHRACA